MRLFGYILILLNLAAAGAFVYFGMKDYRGRQQIQASGLRHILVLQGLPLEGADQFDADGEVAFQIEMAGQYQTEKVSKKLLESYFKANTVAAPGDPKSSFATQEPVTNQLAEVKRVYKLVEDGLTARNEEFQKRYDEVKKAEPTRAADPAKWQKLMDELVVAAAARNAAYEKWLLYQAESLDERMEYQALLAPTGADDKPKSADQLKADGESLEKRLRGKFEAVLAKPDPARATTAEKLPDTKALADDLSRMHKARQKLVTDMATPDELKAQDARIAAKRKELADATDKCNEQLKQVAQQRAAGTRDTAERRLRIAHLLVHLDTDGAWQKRVAVVVGLRHYLKAVVAQAQRFREMATGLERDIPIDQAGFIALENDLRDNAIRNYARARAVADLKKRTGDQLLADEASIARRITDITKLKDQLQKVKDEVARLLVHQSGIEQQLFEIQREVGLTLDEIYRLEELLETTERERYGLPSRP